MYVCMSHLCICTDDVYVCMYFGGKSTILVIETDRSSFFEFRDIRGVFWMRTRRLRFIGNGLLGCVREGWRDKGPIS